MRRGWCEGREGVSLRHAEDSCFPAVVVDISWSCLQGQHAEDVEFPRFSPVVTRVLEKLLASTIKRYIYFGSIFFLKKIHT